MDKKHENKCSFEYAHCDCRDCTVSEHPCHSDCERDEECIGCRLIRWEREEIEFEIDVAQGRR